MRITLKLLFITILSLAYAGVLAQQRQEVSGIVTNEKGDPLKSATVFIAGTDRIMATDENGRFDFMRIPQGTFKLAVRMLGSY